MAKNWYSKIQDKVFTVMSTRMKKALKKSFPGTNYTTSSWNEDDPVFPTWCLRRLSWVEVGNDLENTSVNAVNVTFEVKVFTKDESSCEEILAETISQFKALRFNVVMMPIIERNMRNYYNGAIRATRIIGGGDNDLI